MIVTGPASVSTFFASPGRPCGWVGQPTWAQRFEMIVKLGTSSFIPLLRMKAVRRPTEPSLLFE